MTMGLTQRQIDALRIIDEMIRSTGKAPTMRELAREMDMSSASGVHWLVTKLEERGAIRRLDRGHRAIEVLVPVPPIEEGPVELTEAGRAQLGQAA